MYTLLLVDDEEDVIEVIERKVSWEQIGFHVVGHAGNGFKALEMMEDMQPDVVMTDIRMPYMDGLELCSNIRQRFPATKLLLFTGFDDFEYAKEAVHLEIEEYILKPLNLAEITEVFKKLKTKLDDELNEKKNTDILKQYYAASLPVLQSNFYTTLIEGRIPENELGRYMSDYKISLEGPYYCCIIIHTSASQMPQGMDIRLLTVSVERQAQADLKERWNGRIFNYLGDTVMIAQLVQQEDISELTDECDRFCKYVNHVMGAKVTVGIGQVCECIQELVLQPILENALNYGIRELDDFGEIVVGGKKVGEDIIITVSDNGMGIPENEIPLLLTNTDRVHKKGSGVGLVNVNNRIKILFGERYGLHIESELDEGTVVTIKIPAIVYSEENRLQFEEHHIV